MKALEYYYIIVFDVIFSTFCLCVCQGPCTGNQQSLAHSRLWDAVVGFLHVFAHMMMKLAQVRYTLINTHILNQFLAILRIQFSVYVT